MSLGLRVINGGRTAVCSTSDLSPASLERFAAETVELAAISEPDEFAGLPEPALLATDVSAAGLALYDEHLESLTTEQKIQMAKACEGAAFAADPRINNSDGASLSTRMAKSHWPTLSDSVSIPRTTVSLVVEAIADGAEGKKRNGYGTRPSAASTASPTPKRLAALPHAVRSTSSVPVRLLPARSRSCSNR